MARNFYKAPDRAKVRFLELGSGPGANLWYLGREGFDVTAIEGSKTAVTQAQERLDNEGIKNVRQINSDILFEMGEFEDNSFDAVVDSQCFSHIPIPYLTKILAEIKRVLKPGGLFYSRTFSTDMANENYHLDNDGIILSGAGGGLAGKGFARLTDINMIKKLYGSMFDITYLNHEQAIDYTPVLLGVTDALTDKLSEWVIIAKK